MSNVTYRYHNSRLYCSKLLLKYTATTKALPIYVCLSPTIHYNASVFCQHYQRQPVFIRYPLDV